MNKQPFYGRIDLLVTLAGVAIDDSMANEIRKAVHLAITNHTGHFNDVVEVVVESYDGEWGDPADLL